MWGSEGWVQGAKGCPGSSWGRTDRGGGCPVQGSIVWSCWRWHGVTQGLERWWQSKEPPKKSLGMLLSVLGVPPFASPELWVWIWGRVLSARPASRQECAGNSSLLRWALLASLAPRARRRCRLQGQGPKHPSGQLLGVRPLPSLPEMILGYIHPLPLLPDVVLGCIHPLLAPRNGFGAHPAPPKLLPGMHPAAATSLPKPPQTTCPRPLGGPPPFAPSPAGRRNACAWKSCAGARVAWELGNLILGNGAEGRGHSLRSWSPAPFVSPAPVGPVAPSGPPSRNGECGCRGGSQPVLSPGDAVSGSHRLLPVRIAVTSWLVATTGWGRPWARWPAAGSGDSTLTIPGMPEPVPVPKPPSLPSPFVLSLSPSRSTAAERSRALLGKLRQGAERGEPGRGGEGE